MPQEGHTAESWTGMHLTRWCAFGLLESTPSTAFPSLHNPKKTCVRTRKQYRTKGARASDWTDHTGDMATEVLLSSPRTAFLPEPGCRGHANLTQQRWDTVLQRLEQSLAPAGYDILHPLSVAWCALSVCIGM